MSPQASQPGQQANVPFSREPHTHVPAGEPGATLPVSVVIPAYNASEWLERSVNSLFADGWPPPSEVIIVDDASTDSTIETAESLAARLPGLRVVKRSQNGGVAAARLEGVRAARREWIASIDSDDFVSAGAVSIAYSEATRHDADICIWDLFRDDASGSRMLVDTNDLVFPMTGREAARLTLGGWRMHRLGVMRRSLFIKANEGVDVDAYHSDELVTRVVLFLARSVVRCSATYHYVENHASNTLSPTTNRIGLLSAHSWLVRFAESNGYLASDRSLAVQMVNHGIGLTRGCLAHPQYAIGTNDSNRVTEDADDLVALLRAINPTLRIAGLGKVKGSVWRLQQLRLLRKQVAKRRAEHSISQPEESTTS